MDIPQLQYNGITIPAGRYTQSELMAIINARLVTEDNYNYIVFDQPPDESLSNCYYFHNSKIGETSCLDCIYTVVNDDTVFDLVNYTRTIDTATDVKLRYGVSDINGKLFFPVDFNVSFTGTLHDYYANICKCLLYRKQEPTLEVYSNKYYITKSNNLVWCFIEPDEQYLKYVPTEDIINPYKLPLNINPTNISAYNPVRYIFPESYFNYGIPCILLPQFKQTTSIKLPSGIYTFSEFKEVLSTVEWPTGYTYNADTSTLSTSCAPEYTFAIETSLFNIPAAFSTNLHIEDPLQKYIQSVFVRNNMYSYCDLKDNNVLIMRNNTPVSIPLCSGVNVMQSNEKFIQLQQREYRSLGVFNLLEDVNIPVNSAYKSVNLHGYLMCTDITSQDHTATINDVQYNVSTPLNINRTFTQPLTMTGKNIVLVCRVSYVDPV